MDGPLFHFHAAHCVSMSDEIPHATCTFLVAVADDTGSPAAFHEALRLRHSHDRIVVVNVAEVGTAVGPLGNGEGKGGWLGRWVIGGINTTRRLSSAATRALRPLGPLLRGSMTALECCTSL